MVPYTGAKSDLDLGLHGLRLGNWRFIEQADEATGYLETQYWNGTDWSVHDRWKA